MMSRGAPAWERSAFLAAYPAIAIMMRHGMNISERSAGAAAEDIDRIFLQVEQCLSDGRHFLAGEHFSIADIAFAALAAPVLLPTGHPGMPNAEDAFNEQAKNRVEKWRGTRAGRFALGLYETHRQQRRL